MSKAFAFISNATSQTITGGGVVNPGTAVHGFGCACCGRTIQLSGTNINLRESGYYQVDVGATVSASAAGNVTLALYQDGALVAQGSETIAGANDPASISFPAGVKVNCSSVLTLVVTSTAGDPIVTNIYTTVEKA